MKLFATAWTSPRSLSWSGRFTRLAILCLPWQTRLFVPAGELGGQVWEQGRWSLYVTMLLIVLAAFFRCVENRQKKPILGKMSWSWLLAFPLVFTLLFPTLSWAATWQWVGQVGLLIVFGSLIVTDDSLRERFWFWIVCALVPVVLLALIQTITQFVFASKWLGMAFQDPLVRGVSVIEVRGTRFLRAYGAFPHPNILGGWMAFGTLLVIQRTLRSEKPQFLFGFLLLFSAALYASFSRSAWLGFFAGLGALSLLALRDRRRRLFLLVSLVIIAVFKGGFFLRPDLVRTRVASQDRLEMRSTNERKASLEQGVSVFSRHLLGTGVAAYRVGLDAVCRSVPCEAPAEPPHLVPLLALAELGLVRTFLLICAAGWIFWRSRKRFEGESVSVFGAMLFVLAGFDHYPWSLWSGQTLALLVLLSAIVPRKEIL